MVILLPEDDLSQAPGGCYTLVGRQLTGQTSCLLSAISQPTLTQMMRVNAGVSPFVIARKEGALNEECQAAIDASCRASTTYLQAGRMGSFT